LSFNRTQSRVVTGLLTGNKTLRRHLYLMGRTIFPYVGGVEQSEKPQPIFCKCEALVALILVHAYLGSNFLELEDIKILGLEAI
jgi:hypothetical protein